jgi:hypothetical protein
MLQLLEKNLHGDVKLEQGGVMLGWFGELSYATLRSFLRTWRISRNFNGKGCVRRAWRVVRPRRVESVVLAVQ